MTDPTSRLTILPFALVRLACVRLVAVTLIGLTTVTAAHAQATISDCEKISAADAYNQCLAKFGPPSKGGNLAPERPGDVKGSSEEAAAAAGKPKGAGKAVARRSRHGRGGHFARHGGGGRKRMTFSIKRRR